MRAVSLSEETRTSDEKGRPTLAASLLLRLGWDRTRFRPATDKSGCPTLAASLLLRLGWDRTRFRPATDKSGCPTLAASLLLRLGWGRTRFRPATDKSGCPTLAASLPLRLTWDRTRSQLLFAASRTAALAALCAPLALTACKPVGPNYTRPTFPPPAAYKDTGATSVTPPPNPQGGSWTPANPSDGMLKGNWWQIYHDPQLNRLEDRIAANNVQLQQAYQTYQAARAQVAAVRANLYPFLGAGLSASRDKVSSNRPHASSAASSTTATDLLLSGQASWEPDFWGRIRRSIEAAHANSQATAADMASIDLSLHAEMASDYFALRGLDAQQQLLTRTVSDMEHQLDLTQRRLRGGVATESDVALARTQLQTTRAQLVDIGVARAQLEHAIGTLANYDITTFTLAPAPLDLALPQVPTGVPSQLLERRPDIAAAERLANAANAQIGVAVSAFYPTITLGGAGGFESAHPGTWIQGPSSLWSLGAQASQLLLDAGQRHAFTAEARHAYLAQVAAYRNTVFQAFNDVEDQLSALQILEQEAAVEGQAVAAAQSSFDISNTRYTGGVTSYLEVLTAEATLLQNQRTAIDIETRRFASSVALIRSLGGGWDVTLLPK
jgi:NodT family efflux transporter outer membrane factor (OMF) lipoprotein